MHESLAVAIALIITAGVGSQWLGHWLRIPSVLFLLPAGVLLGPVTGLVDPEELFGDAMFPLIAVAVGLVLFEGGSGLRIRGTAGVRRPVIGLVTIGLMITWIAGGIAATLFLQIPAHIGFLAGAILVVSGPTVVLPLLEVVHLREPVSSILRWECIAIDPIGAVLAVAVFNTVMDSRAGFNPLMTLSRSALVGTVVGVVAGYGLAFLLRLHVVPDRLHNPVTLSLVITCFVSANELSVEAGLFAATVMGVVLANQRLAAVGHITGFGGDLNVLVLGSLFVVLGSAADLGAMRKVLLPSLGLLAVILAVRPIAVRISTIGAGLKASERNYLSLIAPRGIVAASVATLFSVSLKRSGIEGAEYLAPAIFVVIIGSVVAASTLARPASRRLEIAIPERHGIVLVGTRPWMVPLGEALARHGTAVLVADADTGEQAADAGLLTFTGSVESEELVEALEGVGVGMALVASDNETINTYVVERLSDLLGRSNVYRVDAHRHDRPRIDTRVWGRPVFSDLIDDQGSTWEIVEIPPGDHDGRFEGDPVPLFAIPEGSAPVVVRRGKVPQDTTVIAARPVVRPGHIA